MAYNFLGDSPFMIYKPAEKTKVEIFTPLGDSYDISSWADRIDETSKGYIPVVKNQIGEITSEKPTDINAELIVNNNPEMEMPHTQKPKVTQEESIIIPSNSNKTTTQKGQYKLNSNINNRVKYAMDFFISKGLTNFQAAGIVGNLLHESASKDLNTSAIGDGGKSIGIAQWNGPRRRKLEQYAESKNTPVSDLTTQLEFLWYEITEDKDQKPFKILDGIKNSKTIEEATTQFMKRCERPSVPHLKNRIKCSKSLLS